MTWVGLALAAVAVPVALLLAWVSIFRGFIPG
jgi:hypothetical protein